MQVRIRDGEVEDVELQIYEPPRFFEAFLRGRDFKEAPDITARICGICPVAYMTSAFNAMEDALGVEVDEQIRSLRRLMYCGEWIESHALHVFLLHAPDFLGFESAWAMARDHREVVEGGLKIKAMGNELLRRDRRPSDPSNQHPRRRLLQGPEQSGSRGVGARPGGGEGVGARVGGLGRWSGLPGLRAGLRVRRAPAPGSLRDRGRASRLQLRARHRARRVRRALRRGAGPALDGTAVADERRGHLLPRADGPLLTQLRAALGRGAGGGGGGRPW